MLIQVTIEGWAKEVGTADELRSAITSGESYITLTSSIELGDNQTLTISSETLRLIWQDIRYLQRELALTEWLLV